MNRLVVILGAVCTGVGAISALIAIWDVGLSTFSSVALSIAALAMLLALGAATALVWSAARRWNTIARETQRACRAAKGDSERIRVEMSRFAYRIQMPAEKAEVYSRRAADLLLASSKTVPLAGDSAHVLFVTSNGHGLGHVTRCLAIASAGRGEFHSTVLTLSSARLPTPADIPVIKFPSRANAEPQYVWNLRFQRYLEQTLAENHFDAVVFDGPSVFPAVISSTLGAGLPLAWICRGLWREDAPATISPWQRECCDLVIVPGEEPLVNAEEYVPSGLSALTVPPVVVGLEGGFVPRAQARKELGIGPEEKAVLISLGPVGARDQVDVLKAAVEAVRDLGNHWLPVVVRSPLDADGRERSFAEIATYPIAPNLLAFDAAVVAAGYNSVHEVMAAGIPCVIVPNPLSVTDDQERRAQAVEERGAGVVAGSASSVRDALKEAVVNLPVREQTLPTGAQAAAEAIADMVRSSKTAFC